MPNYEYECENCANNFDVLQKMSDEPIKTCPKCGGEVHRVLRSFAVNFIGSGFYVNDKRTSESSIDSSSTSKSSCAGKSCNSCSGC